MQEFDNTYTQYLFICIHTVWMTYWWHRVMRQHLWLWLLIIFIGLMRWIMVFIGHTSCHVLRPHLLSHTHSLCPVTHLPSMQCCSSSHLCQFRRCRRWPTPAPGSWSQRDSPLVASPVDPACRERGRGRYTAEPPNKGQFGGINFVPCREVVPISLSEVPL